MIKLQEALYHRPGNFSAFASYKIVHQNDALKQIASLLAVAGSDDLPENLHLLIALNPKLVKEKIPEGGNATIDLLLQISAASRRDMMMALRLAGSLLGAFKLVEEVYGGDFMFGSEPFGFYDGPEYDPQQINDIAAIKSGAGENGSWLLYHRFSYELAGFLGQSRQTQWEAVGAEFARHDIETPTGSLPDDAHTKLMSASKQKMIRRGSPFRLEGKEGLSFVAAAADLTDLQEADAAMEQSSPHLKDHLATAEKDILFVIPPDPQWLVGKPVSVPPLPDTVEALLLRTELGDPLVMTEYVVTQSFTQFISELREVAFEGGGVNPEVEKLIQAIIAIAAGGTLSTVPTVTGQDPIEEARIKSTYEKTVSDAVRYNYIAGRYMTLN